MSVIDFGDRGDGVKREVIQKEGNEFRETHHQFFSARDFEVIGKRLDVGVAKIRHGMDSNMFGGNTDDLDDLYLTELDYTYTFRCGKN